MEKLVSYVRAIHGLSSVVSIVQESIKRESWLDQGFEVQKEECVYRFDNGALIRRTIEQDHFPSELACAECFIAYKVLEQPLAQQISPIRQLFGNACRELFWLKYHSA
jgi:hypothetical protein